MEPLGPGDPAQVGSYRLVSRLGTTGLGQAYAGRPAGGGPLVTVTLLHPQLAQDPAFRDRFRSDVTNARRVTGTYVLPVDAETEGPAPWLAGGSPDVPSLDAFVAEHGPLQPPAVRELAVALAGALVSVQDAGALLTGLEPSNVAMTSQGPRLSHVGITHTAPVGGTTDADAVRDAGAVLHLAATGRLPDASGGGQPPHADPVLGPLIADCLAAQPAARPTARELAARLRGGPAAAAQPPTMAAFGTPPGAAGFGTPPGAAAFGTPPPPPGAFAAPPGPPAAGPPPVSGSPFAAGPPPGTPAQPGGARQPWWREASVPVMVAAVVLAVLAVFAFSAGDGSADADGLTPAATSSSAPELPASPGDVPTDGSTGPADDGSDGGGSATPTAPPTQDPVASARIGDCFTNTGTASSPDLSSTYCQAGAFKAVQVLHGTTATSGCDNVPGDDWNVSSAQSGTVLCLSYQYEHGTAYHAKTGSCVYGRSATSDWDELTCQTGAFTVIARYTGTTDGSRCKKLHNEDWSEHFGVAGRTDLGVVLCLSMVYPDDAGHATLHECMRLTGSSTHPSLHGVSCNSANVTVTGRTPHYNDSKFCGTDAWATWKPDNYAALAYTLCYRYR